MYRVASLVKYDTKKLLPSIAALMSSNVTLDSFERDITDCAKLVLKGPDKRRRADEVITDAVGTQVVTKGLAVSSALLTRCNPSLFARSDGALLACDFKHMRSYISAAWMNFHDSEFISIAYDGFRAFLSSRRERWHRCVRRVLEAVCMGAFDGPMTQRQGTAQRK